LVDQVVEIPLGFHNGEGFVQIAASEQAKIIPENIKAGVTILGVEGSAIELDGEEIEVEATTIEQVLTPDEGNGFTKVTVAAVTSDIDEYILSDNIKAGVTILGVDGKASVVDTADATASAEEILKDKVAYVNGVKVTGTYVKPILHKPTASIEDGILTITPNADNGIYAEGYKIYVDGTLLLFTSETEIELGLLLDEPGTYAVTVATYGTSFIDSPETEAVEFVLAE
jgi:hypothetical protein